VKVSFTSSRFLGLVFAFSSAQLALAPLVLGALLGGTGGDAAGAIDFQRAPRSDAETFDLVLDMRPRPAFTMHQPPQGYFHVGSDPQALHKAILELRDAVGEFEKPRFFQYDQKICAHSRNERIGCTACIDVCSARAISSDASLKGKLQGKVRGGPERVGVGDPAHRSRPDEPEGLEEEHRGSNQLRHISSSPQEPSA